MTRFSANLGFLWTDLSLPDAIRRAKAAGFEAVEAHFPYDVPVDLVVAALAETGLPLLGINTIRGGEGENGLAALKGREIEARAAIDQALDYAHASGAGMVHVMAGRCGDEATYIANLRYAAEEARDLGKTILIEPLNTRDAPEYFLTEVEQAAEIITRAGASNIRIMFDCYHVQVMQGDLLRRFEALMPLIGHVQIAGAPGRGEPDTGEIAYERLLPAIAEMGWSGFVGAEYRPKGATGESLGWMEAFR
ncbi:hydroxypyruvate isomerase family protein [Pikeienuella sp. HZG-20]|uniref:hydroxypyruvate isomerase family protein n=1 Tax=Paludibacillus litoralis TaxID=3133267 RepID=UPI0030ED4CB0